MSRIGVPPPRFVKSPRLRRGFAIIWTGLYNISQDTPRFVNKPLTLGLGVASTRSEAVVAEQFLGASHHSDMIAVASMDS